MSTTRLWSGRMSIPLKDPVERRCDGAIGRWDDILGIVPGGRELPILRKGTCEEILMDFDSLRNAQSGLGTGTVIVMNKPTDVVFKGYGTFLQVLQTRVL
ncbi:NADH dehydrogenase [ubiquinone] flavoprotein 1, mitochondrial [Ceratobasidium sp. UAMH 11750]|nr:NADH dehydrogenase [ubiquinone] flavoprotein 1, mitochondrial [Ceratobasidium sp. UAMH 11750]